MSAAEIRRVDCHVHYHPSEFAEALHQHTLKAGSEILRLVFERPAWRDLNALTAMMHRTGVDLGLVIPTATPIMALRDLGGPIHELTAAYNQGLSRELAAAGGRYLGVAIVDPLGGPEDVKQLERSLRLPSIAGIGLLTNYGDMTLDDPRFEPIFDLARDHDVPITVHPGQPWPSWVKPLRLLETQFLRAGLGFYLCDAMCLFLLANAGVFARYRDVRFMFCQLGGIAPICCGRWEFQGTQERLLQERLGGPMPEWVNVDLRDVLSRVWLDTHTQDRWALELVMREAGAHTIVLGGDYPFTEPELGMDYTRAELDALHLSAEVRRQIERDNALAFLGSRAPAHPG